MHASSKKTLWHLCLSLLAAASPHSLTAAGPDKVDLRSTAPFVILSGAGITTTGGGAINGDVGASPIAGSAIGVACPQVTGTIYAVDASGPACAVIDASLLTAAKGDLTTAYNDAAGRTPIPSGPNLNPGLIPGSGNIGGMTLAPGLYKFTTTAMISGADVTLMGGPNDVWIFQCAQDLQLASGISVILAGGARAENIFWQVGTSAVLGTSSSFKGTILADQSITMETSSTIEGRALAFEAGVVFNGSGAAAPIVLADEPEIVVEQPLGIDIPDGGSRDFGSVVVGDNNSLTFTINNTGTADLSVDDLVIDGIDAALFTVTLDPSPTTVSGPDGSTTFTVQFAPLTTGLKTAALRIGNNDSNEAPFDIALTGTATVPAEPEIVVEEPLGIEILDGGSRDFGSIALGDTNSLTFTIKNIGSADLTGLGITIDGVDASLFSVTASPTSPVTGPDGSTTFTVEFAPPLLESTGLKTAALHIANNDSNENPFDIALTGEVTAVAEPEIVVEDSLGADISDGGSQDFGNVLVGEDKSLTFTIKNTGTADLTGLDITIDGADALLFEITAFPTSPVAGPDGSTTFTVRFVPLDSGLKTAALHIANNDSNENPFDINLTGNATTASEPEIVVEQPLGTDIPNGGSKDFGSVVAGDDTSLIFTIKNTGTADLTLLDFMIDGTDATLFSVTVDSTVPVGPGGGTTFTVRFAPLTDGLKTATLHIENNDSSENPFDIILTGTATTGAEPEIVVEQPLGTDIPDGGSKDFGSVEVDGNESLIFTIKNTGTGDLTGLGITIDGTDAALFTVTVDPTAPVGPGGGTTFTVRFAPLASEPIGLKTAALHIANNDSTEDPFDINLSGTASPVTTSVLSPIELNPQTGLFEQTIRLTNLSDFAIDAARVLIRDLPSDVVVYNASGETGGIPFVQYNYSLAAGESVDLVIEYYSSSRETIPQPSFVAEDAIVIIVADPGGTPFEIDRALMLEDGRFLIEFSATPGSTYGVQYSSDMTAWTKVVPTITAPSNKVQWYDDGPPKTESMPVDASSRFYRIFELP